MPLAISHLAQKKQCQRLVRGLPFEHIKDSVLGKRYKLSLVFAGSYRMRTLNAKYRKKKNIPNTLSFSLSKTCGEIFINTDRIHIEAKNFELSKKGYVAFLLIHGMLHLKGMEHSATMERREQEVLRMFDIR